MRYYKETLQQLSANTTIRRTLDVCGISRLCHFQNKLASNKKKKEERMAKSTAKPTDSLQIKYLAMTCP